MFPISFVTLSPYTQSGSVVNAGAPASLTSGWTQISDAQQVYAGGQLPSEQTTAQGPLTTLSQSVSLTYTYTSGKLFPSSNSIGYMVAIALLQPPFTAISSVQTNASGTSAASTSLVLTYPSTPTSGNKLIAFIAQGANSVASTGPSGWTLAQSEYSTDALECWWKDAGASEPTTYTWTLSTSVAVGDATGYEYTNVATGSTGINASAASTGTATSLVTGSVTPTVLHTQPVAAWSGIVTSWSTLTTGWTIGTTATSTSYSCQQASQNTLTGDTVTAISASNKSASGSLRKLSIIALLAPSAGSTTASQTATASGDIAQTTTKTASASGDIKNTGTKAATASGDISAIASTTAAASGDISKAASSTAVASGDIAQSATKTATASGDIQKTTSATSSAFGVIKQTTTKAVPASGDIAVSATRTATASGDIAQTISQTAPASGDIASKTTKAAGASGTIQGASSSTLTAAASADIAKTASAPAGASGDIKAIAAKTAAASADLRAIAAATSLASGDIQAKATKAAGGAAAISAHATQSATAGADVAAKGLISAGAFGALLAIGLRTAGASAAVAAHAATASPASAAVRTPGTASAGATAYIVTAPITGTAATTQAPQTVYAVGIVVDDFYGSGATAQAPQTVAAIGSFQPLGLGRALLLNAGGFDMTGCTVTILAAPGNSLDLGVPLRLTPVGIFEDGLLAVYREIADEFAIGGEWTLQLEVATTAGDLFTSPPELVYFPPVLDAAEEPDTEELNEEGYADWE